MKGKVMSVATGLVLVAVLGFGLTRAFQSRAAKDGTQASKQLSVDAVIEHPQKFTGAVSVAGTVAKVDAAKGMFTLGCADECAVMPVKFAGTLPATGSSVVVQGQIQSAKNGRYLFAAEKVIPK